MIKVGLTGGIGSGKSTVAAIFEKFGIPVFYADQEAKWLLNRDPEIKTALIEAFGSDLYTENGLDRKKLAGIIFEDKTAIKKVNGVVHPAVYQRFEDWSARQKSPYVLQEAAILFETGGYKRMDQNILVSAPVRLRIHRIKSRDGSTVEEIKSRMANQWEESHKIPLADFVILNDGSQMLLPQIKSVHEDLLRFANQSS